MLSLCLAIERHSYEMSLDSHMWSLPNPQSLFKLTDNPKTCNPAYKTLYQLWYNKKKLRKKNLLFHLLIFQVNEDVFKESDYPFPQLWQTFGQLVSCRPPKPALLFVLHSFHDHNYTTVTYSMIKKRGVLFYHGQNSRTVGVMITV